MLRRFLKSLGGPAENAPTRQHTYLEGVFQRATESGRLASLAPNEPIVALGQLILTQETDDGLEPIELVGMQHEQFLRTYATLLLDNDKLPAQLQLTMANLAKPRSLLRSFFTNSPNIQRDAQSVLKFIEEKYSTGRFGQARLLLQLFDTDEATRRANERNLFYEEMILAFMSKRETQLDEFRKMDYQRVIANAMLSDEEGLAQIVRWLAANAGIRLNVFGQRPEDFQIWDEALATISEAARSPFLLFVPNEKWRLSSEFGMPILLAIQQHLDRRILRDYTLGLTKVAYFITLAPGETGFENLLLRYIDWVTEKFDTVATRILPQLHRSSTLEEVGLGDCLERAYQTHFAHSKFGTGVFSPEAVREAVLAVRGNFAHLDLNTIPEGDYDLTGMILDQLVGLELPEFAHSLRVHRLT
jgi:hypothetical protein